MEEVAFRLEKRPEAHSLGGWSRRAGERAQPVWDSFVAEFRRRVVSRLRQRALKAGLAFIWGHILRPREPPRFLNREVT